jgi:hypothetical protein
MASHIRSNSPLLSASCLFIDGLISRRTSAAQALLPCDAWIGSRMSPHVFYFLYIYRLSSIPSLHQLSDSALWILVDPIKHTKQSPEMYHRTQHDQHMEDLVRGTPDIKLAWLPGLGEMGLRCRN